MYELEVCICCCYQPQNCNAMEAHSLACSGQIASYGDAS